MKKLFASIFFLLLSFTVIYSQNQKAKDFENPHPEALPGYSYGFDWPTWPPLPPDPHGPEPWTSDLAVTINKIGTITQENGRPYFTVRFQIVIKNLGEKGRLDFYLKVDQNFIPPSQTNLDPYLINAPNKFYLITNLKANSSTMIEDTIHINYPYIIKSRDGERNYLQIPVDIMATIPSNGFRTNEHTVIVLDPIRENNTAKITITTPLPNPSIKPNIN